MGLIVFGAGGLALQILDFVEPAAVFVTDFGGGALFGRKVGIFDPASRGDLVCAVSDIAVRRRVVATWPGAFATVVAPSAEVSSHARIDDGAIIGRQAVVEAGAAIGAHAHLNIRAAIGHGTTIGAFCTIGPGVLLCGDCTVGDGVTIGAGAAIKEGVTIGDGAVIAMGAMVHRDVPEGCLAIGSRVLPKAAPDHPPASRPVFPVPVSWT